MPEQMTHAIPLASPALDYVPMAYDAASRSAQERPMADEETQETQTEETPSTTTEIPGPPQAIPQADEAAETAPEAGDETAHQDGGEAQPSPKPTQQRPGWDKQRQKLQQELAQARKEKDELNAKLIAALEQKAAPQITPAASAAQAEDDVEKLYEDARKAADPDDPSFDLQKSQQLIATAGKIQAKRDRETREMLRQQREQLGSVENLTKEQRLEVQREAALSERLARDGVERNQADTLLQSAWEFAKECGLTGAEAHKAATGYFNRNYASLPRSKKASKPANPPAQRTPTPAPTAPLDAKVDEGAELSPQERAKAAKAIGSALRNLA